jgi:hypothetical protein
MDVESTPQKAYGVVQDITKVKIAEEEAKKSTLLLQKLSSQVPGSLYYMNFLKKLENFSFRMSLLVFQRYIQYQKRLYRILS